MNLLLRAGSGVLKRFGSINTKRAIWNKEFKDGKWKYLTRARGDGDGDPFFALVEKYCNKGKILDLGCGTGTMAAFLNPDGYDRYTGIDISDIAIQAAAMASNSDPVRASKNSFLLGDIKDYIPDTKYDLIVFVESLYYINTLNATRILKRYLGYLTDQGAIVVRVHSHKKFLNLLNRIRQNFKVLEEHTSRTGRCSIAFR